MVFLSHRKNIALRAQKVGYDVTIVTKDTGQKQNIEALGLKMIDLPMNRSGQNIIEELYTCWFLYRLYCRERPDLVHHVGLKTILWGTLAAKLSKVHGVVNAVSGLGIFSLRKIDHWFRGFSLRYFVSLINVKILQRFFKIKKIKVYS